MFLLPSGGQVGVSLLIASPPLWGGRERFHLLPLGEVGRGSCSFLLTAEETEPKKTATPSPYIGDVAAPLVALSLR